MTTETAPPASVALTEAAPVGSVWQSQLTRWRVYTVLEHRPERPHRSGRVLEPDALCRRHHDRVEVWLPARAFSDARHLRCVGSMSDGWRLR